MSTSQNNIHDLLRRIAERRAASGGAPPTPPADHGSSDDAAATATAPELHAGDEPMTASSIEAAIKRHVLDQELAVRSVSERLSISLNGLSLRTAGPLGAFLLVGPPGVGKTTMARAIAEAVFGDASKLVCADGSECATAESVNRWVGPPPGYAGYNDERGWISSQVAAHPDGCVVLLDEVEKAHPAVHDLMLQITDAGRLTDAHGRTVSFGRTVILLTSNLGSRDAQRGPVGFGNVRAQEHGHGVIDRAVEGCLRPELISRLDAIVHFGPLDQGAMSRIAKHTVERFVERVADSGWHLAVGEGVLAHISRLTTDWRYGARHLERAIEQEMFLGLAGRRRGSYVASIERGKVTWSPLAASTGSR